MNGRRSRSPIDLHAPLVQSDVGGTALKQTRPLDQLRLSSAPASLLMYVVLPTPLDASTCLGTLPLLLARNERLLSRQSPRTVAIGRSDRGRGSAERGCVLSSRIYDSRKTVLYSSSEIVRLGRFYDLSDNVPTMTTNQYDEILSRLEAIEAKVGTPPPMNFVQKVEGYNWWLLAAVFFIGFSAGFGLYQL